MPHPFQVTIDAASPRRLGAFWREVLGYVEEPPPPGFVSWEDALDAAGIDRSDPDRAYAIVDPEGSGPRVFLQKVPEAKTAKNRLHLDISVGPDAMAARAEDLVALGARVTGRFDEPGGRWIAMADPEGNEFCLH